MAVEGYQVEDEQPNRLFDTQPLDLTHAAEPAHHLLKGEGMAGAVDGDYLAVEYRLGRVDPARGLEDLGQARGNFVEAAREDADGTGGPMDLHAGAVKLVL